MHFKTTLTFSREAVKLHYQPGQKETRNPTPGTTWPQWTIETITPPTNDNKTSGFRCSLINKMGFAPAEQPQLTSEPGETPPPSNTSLENVRFMRKTTIAEATRQLRITNTANNHTITYVKPADEANNRGITGPQPRDQTRDNTRNQQEILSTEQEQIRQRIMNTCYSQQIGDQMQENEQRTPVIIICDSWLPSQYHARTHEHSPPTTKIR